MLMDVCVCIKYIVTFATNIYMVSDKYIFR